VALGVHCLSDPLVGRVPPRGVPLGFSNNPNLLLLTLTPQAVELLACRPLG